jgi:hypothetical protein
MFEKKLQVKIVLKNIPSDKFGMLKIDSLNKEENIESSKSSPLYIYIYEHIIFLLCCFLSNSKCIIDMLQYKFFDVRSLM